MKMFIFPLLNSAWVLFLMKYGHTRRCWRRQRRWWVCGSSCKIYEVRKILQISLSFSYFTFPFTALSSTNSWTLLNFITQCFAFKIHFYAVLKFLVIKFFFLFYRNCFACDFIFPYRKGEQKKELEEMLKWRDYFSAHIRPEVHIELRSKNVKISQWGNDKSSGKNFQPSAHSVSYFFTTHFILLALE